MSRTKIPTIHLMVHPPFLTFFYYTPIYRPCLQRTPIQKVPSSELEGTLFLHLLNDRSQQARYLLLSKVYKLSNFSQIFFPKHVLSSLSNFICIISIIILLFTLYIVLYKDKSFQKTQYIDKQCLLSYNIS